MSDRSDYVDYYYIRNAYLLSSSLYNSLPSEISYEDSHEIEANRKIVEKNIKSIRYILNRDEYDDVDIIRPLCLGIINQSKLMSLMVARYFGDLGIDIDSEVDKVLNFINESDHSQFDWFREYIKKMDRIYTPIQRYVIRIKSASALIRIMSFKAGWLEYSDLSKGEIVRSLSFPPEFKQAAVSVLSYFSEILDTKYPDMEVGVSIEQEGSRVTMKISVADGEVEVIERELNDYSLVVSGKKSIDSYVEDDGDVLRLRHKLEIASMELRHTRDLLGSERKSNSQKIQILQSHVEMINSMLNRDRNMRDYALSALATISMSAREDMQDILDIVKTILVESGSDANMLSDRIKNELSGSGIGKIMELKKLLMTAAVQGPAGNYIYDILIAISKLI